VTAAAFSAVTTKSGLTAAAYSASTQKGELRPLAGESSMEMYADSRDINGGMSSQQHLSKLRRTMSWQTERSYVAAVMGLSPD
jgi:hypothetical protein